MKSLKFTTELKEKILSGEKTGTWRLFDDKDLKVGDMLEFFVSGEDLSFSTAEIVEIKIKKLEEVTEEDIAGKYKSIDEMYEIQSRYYKNITPDTEVKMIEFKLI